MPPRRFRIYNSLLFLIVFFLPSLVFSQAFPIYDHEESVAREQRTETHRLYPFGFTEDTSDTLTYGVRPFYSVVEKKVSDNYQFDILWPLYTYQSRPKTIGGAKDYESNYIFPLFFTKTEIRNGVEVFSRMFLPIWFDGRTSTGGRYLIILPFVFYVDDVEPALPLTPARKMQVGAFFPIAGQINGYFNREHISFFLWPLFVHSTDGKKSDPGYNEAYSFVWPITGYFTGPNVKGFRLWPLFAWVQQDGEFTRSYFLWPLGLYRKEKISGAHPGEERLFWLLPFYASWTRPNLEFNMVFPFHGHLKMEGREVEGYALGIYNVDYNYRKGVKEQRYLWFIGRKRSPIEGHKLSEDALLGGGVFPLYVNVHKKDKIRKSILWPIYHERYDNYPKFEFDRTYLIPFYARQERRFKEEEGGGLEKNVFFFPFYRTLRSREGIVYTNAPHLFPYIRAEAVDRNWAPLWSWWERWEDTNTGALSLRLFKNVWKFERSADGATRRQLNLLLFSTEKEVSVDGTVTGSTQILGGLLGRHRNPDGTRETELFWMRF